MGPAVNQRISPNRVVLILALLLAVWLGFEFLPRKKPVPPMAPVGAESKLRSMGLPDNEDLEGLPRFFALYAGRAEWVNDKTIFSYWNPGSNSYSYFFEATRAKGEFHFRAIPDPKAAENGEIAESGLNWGDNLPEGCPIRFCYSSSLSKPGNPMAPPHIGIADPAGPREVTRPDQGKIPRVELKLPPPDIEKKR